MTRDFIAGRLAHAGSHPGPEDLHAAPPLEGKLSRAAVLVPIIDRPAGPTVLLTQRTAHLHDHPSQISFPGGRAEPEDRDAIDTALRETREEIGLAAGRIEIIGELPVYHTPSGFQISPFVGWVAPPFELALNEFEVASVFEVPLSFVLNADNYRRRKSYFEGRHRDYRALPFEGRYIWGATAAMLYSLRLRLAG
jgi:8-oxo-dGTP pyrophosphatase MutT (NUDIX family)